MTHANTSITEAAIARAADVAAYGKPWTISEPALTIWASMPSLTSTTAFMDFADLVFSTVSITSAGRPAPESRFHQPKVVGRRLNAIGAIKSAPRWQDGARFFNSLGITGDSLHAGSKFFSK